MQKIMLIGNLTRDPETRTTSDGKSVCNFTIAVNGRVFSRADNKYVPTATFYRISVWGKEGENCQKYLTKGRSVGLTGVLNAGFAKDEHGNLITTKNGEPIYNLDVQADPQSVQFLSNNAANGTGYNAPQGEATAPATPSEKDANSQGSSSTPAGFTAVDFDSDELPF